MKNGTCPKCGARDIQKISCGGQRDYRQLSTFSAVRLDEYVCCCCGLVETFLEDMNDVEKIKRKSISV